MNFSKYIRFHIQYENCFIVLITSTLLILTYLLVRSARKPKLFPPGPCWLPIIGCLLEVKRVYEKKKFFHSVLDHFQHTYGSIVGLKLGKDRMIAVSGYEAVKYVMNCESFEGRPDGFFFRFRSFGERLGLVFVDGPFMHEQRKFCVSQLRNFGLGKSSMYEIITNEAREIVAWITLECEKPIPVQQLFDVSTLNALWTMIAGHRFALNDQKLQKLLNLVHAAFHLVDISGGVLNQMPFLRFIAPSLTGFKSLSAIVDELMDFLKETLNEHRNEKRKDFIGVFMEEVQKGEKNKPRSSFTEKQLMIILQDLFMAGTETTSSTLSFAILYLLKYPEVQQKIQDELDMVVGDHQTPIMDHKLIYLEAFIMEIQRHANPVSVAIPHRALKDSELMGYKIPTDTLILLSIWSIHMNADYWDQPYLFRPERFISEDGQIIQTNYFLPFGLGRRKCIGEVLAKTNLFMFLSNILHKFKVEPADSEVPSEILNGVTLVPAPYKAMFVLRTPKK